MANRRCRHTLATLGGKLSLVLIKKGAEAELFLETWCEKKAIMKRRTPKTYRIPEIDVKLRSYRTIHEAILIHQAKLAGVPTPVIYYVDTLNSTIIMEYIIGKRLKELANESSELALKPIFIQIGRIIGKLHSSGIIHGDLTTSNLILDPQNRIFVIDFGLGKKSLELEEKSVDLFLLKRALNSTHYMFADAFFGWVLEGYSKNVGNKNRMEVEHRIEAIADRGRYTTST